MTSFDIARQEKADMKRERRRKRNQEIAAGRQCWYCKDEQEPGRIEMDNNGPIGECPVCKGTARLPGRSDNAGDRE